MGDIDNYDILLRQLEYQTLKLRKTRRRFWRILSQVKDLLDETSGPELLPDLNVETGEYNTAGSRVVVLPFGLDDEIYYVTENGIGKYCISNITLYDNEIDFHLVIKLHIKGSDLPMFTTINTQNIGYSVFCRQEEAEQSFQEGWYGRYRGDDESDE